MRLLSAYLRERFNPRLYLLLAVIIAVPAAGNLIVDALFALLLLATFRTWDDLADRDRDAREHPERVLVRATSIGPIAVFCGVLGVVVVAFALHRDPSGIAAGVLVSFIVALGASYSLRITRTVASEQVLLAKYAVMVIVVAGARVVQAPVRILSTALALHLAACVYEGWHDHTSPLSIGGPR